MGGLGCGLTAGMGLLQGQRLARLIRSRVGETWLPQVSERRIYPLYPCHRLGLCGLVVAKPWWRDVFGCDDELATPDLEVKDGMRVRSDRRAPVGRGPGRLAGRLPSSLWQIHQKAFVLGLKFRVKGLGFRVFCFGCSATSLLS